MTQVVRTSPTAGVRAFSELNQKIAKLTARWGLLQREKRGSVSWISRTDGQYDTVLKLVHLGNGSMIFGINKQIAEQNEKLRTISWTAEFAVAPQSHVQFVGFRVANDPESVERVRHVLYALGKPQVAGGSSAEEKEAVRLMDQQLKSLREEDTLAAASILAAASVLAAEDFSDWEKE